MTTRESSPAAMKAAEVIAEEFIDSGLTGPDIAHIIDQALAEERRAGDRMADALAKVSECCPAMMRNGQVEWQAGQHIGEVTAYRAARGMK